MMSEKEFESRLADIESRKQSAYMREVDARTLFKESGWSQHKIVQFTEKSHAWVAKVLDDYICVSIQHVEPAAQDVSPSEVSQVVSSIQAAVDSAREWARTFFEAGMSAEDLRDKMFEALEMEQREWAEDNVILYVLQTVAEEVAC